MDFNQTTCVYLLNGGRNAGLQLLMSTYKPVSSIGDSEMRRIGYFPFREPVNIFLSPVS